MSCFKDVTVMKDTLLTGGYWIRSYYSVNVKALQLYVLIFQ